MRGIEAFADKDSITYQWARAHQEIADSFYAEWKHQKELEDMEKRIEERIMKRFTIQLKMDAAPAIRELRKEIENLCK